MNRAVLDLIAGVTLSAPFQTPHALAQTPVLACAGESADREAEYAASLYLNDASRPDLVRVFRRSSGEDPWEALAEFTVFDDVTPTYPSDIVYQYVFHGAEAEKGDLALMVTTGGFTGGTTAGVMALGDDEDDPAVAILPCYGTLAGHSLATAITASAP